MRSVLATVAAVVALTLAAGPVHARSYVAIDETHVQNLVNATRATKGLSTLARNDQLVAMARGQAARMADRGNIYHNPRLGEEITERGLDWQKVGENVGMGPTSDLIESAFLKSPHHYENIVDRTYDSIGIGAVHGDDDRMYVVQVFADLRSQAAKPAAPPVEPSAPVAQASQPVIPAAPVAQPVQPAAQTAPKPTVVAPRRLTPDPNAVVGGVVRPAVLTFLGSDQAKRPDGSILGAIAAPVRRAADFVTFWS